MGLKFAKVADALPQVLAADTVYLVKKAGQPEVQMYVSNSAGSAAYPLANSEEPIHPFLLLGADNDD